MNLNLSASLNVFKLITRPSLCLPHHTVSTFADLPIPLNSGLGEHGKRADIRAVVLDKDDCFAYPDSTEVYKPYKVSAAIPLRFSLPGINLGCETFPSLTNIYRKSSKLCKKPTPAGASSLSPTRQAPRPGTDRGVSQMRSSARLASLS